jgi:6-phosphogluconolactonase
MGGNQSVPLPDDGSFLLYVGTGFPDDETPSKAILRVTLSPETGALTLWPELPVPMENPGWLSPVLGGDKIYVGYETDPGALQAFNVGDGTGGIAPLGPAVSSVGRHPCYVAIDRTGEWCFAANYTEGSVCVCPITRGGNPQGLPGGSLGPATDSKAHQGGDLIAAALHDRQEKAHCHCIVPHPSNAWVAVCDLGLSTVFVYAFDAERGALIGAADDPRHLRMPPGAGCRHAVWDAAGTRLFVHNELDCTVTAAAFDAATGALTETQTVGALPEGVTGVRDHHRGGSDIHLHPNGRLLFVGERSPDPGLIAAFTVGPAGNPAPLRLAGHTPTRGLVPRNFKLVGEEGRWLVVGNQETKTVVSFAVDAETGALTFASELSTAPYKPCNIAGPDAIFA